MPLFVRFSMVTDEEASADPVRDPRGFVVRFYTPDGIWDLVASNTPVSSIRDGTKLHDFARSRRDATATWDFWSRSPESVHQVTILFSDRGTPATYRHMHGFGRHTFSLVNAQGDRVWVKFHLKTQQGIRNHSAAEAQRLGGSDPDHLARDLFDAIARKEFPRWDLKMQVMPESEAARHPDDPFDATKVWSQKDYPLIPLGIVELNRNPANPLKEVERVAFSPGHVVPGIGFSPDRLLHARLFARDEAHHERTGAHAQGGPFEGHPTTFSHFFGLSTLEMDEPPLPEPPMAADEDGARYGERAWTDDYRQAGALYRLLDAGAKRRLVENIVAAMQTLPAPIQLRQLLHFTNADEDYGRAVAAGLTLQRHHKGAAEG
jgi:catalase